MMKKAAFVRKNRDNTENMSNYAQSRSTMIWTSYFSAVILKGSSRCPFVLKFRIKTEKQSRFGVTLGKRILSV